MVRPRSTKPPGSCGPGWCRPPILPRAPRRSARPPRRRGVPDNLGAGRRYCGALPCAGARFGV